MTDKTTFAMYILTWCSCIGGFLFGYDTGVISGALVALQSGDEVGFHMTTIEAETVVSIAILGAIIGAALGGYGNDVYGRRPMILLSSALFTLGAIGMGIATSFTYLVFGRLVVGLAIGLSSMTIPVYIAEASLPEKRGTLVSLNTLMITGGQFFAAVFDGILSSVPNGWRYMLGLAAVPSAIQFLCFLYLPESPRWLKDKGYDKSARIVLQRLRGVEADIGQELDHLHADQPNFHASKWWHEFRQPAVRRAVILGCGLQVLQQLCGINTVMYYCATIIQMAGFAQPSTAIWLSAVVAFSNFAFTFVGIYLVDRIGRRPLTLWSLAGVVVSLAALGSAFYMAEVTSLPLQGVGACSSVSTCFDCVANSACGVCDSKCVPGSPLGPSSSFQCASYSYQQCPGSTASSSWSQVIVVALFVYLACFASGMGCMPWTINAEIYPSHVRSLATGFATTCNWVSNLVVSFTFLTIVSALAPYGAFWLYAVISGIGFVLVYISLPETKGIPLEKIPKLFDPKHGDYQPLY